MCIVVSQKGLDKAFILLSIIEIFILSTHRYRFQRYSIKGLF
jgi:hypothetical protein